MYKTMNKAEVAAKIKEMLIENLRIPEEILSDDAELFGGDIGLDSVDSLEIIAGIDDMFGVNMTGVDKTNFRDINALANYVVENAEA
jgi:acyl carrier protein